MSKQDYCKARIIESLLSRWRCRWLSASSAIGSGPLLLGECAFRAAILLTVGNLPNCSRRHRDKK